MQEDPGRSEGRSEAECLIEGEEVLHEYLQRSPACNKQLETKG